MFSQILCMCLIENNKQRKTMKDFSVGVRIPQLTASTDFLFKLQNTTVNPFLKLLQGLYYINLKCLY